MSIESNKQIEALNEELKQYKEEKEKVRKLVGQIGGTSSTIKEKIVTYGFMIFLLILFVYDVAMLISGMELFFTYEFTLSIAVLMVSLKIIWMIHRQSKVDHFQFWILNSIEYRLNDISKRIRNIEKNK